MSSLFWVNMSFLAAEVGFITTLSVNIFQIYIISKHTKRLFGSYKYLILAFSSACIFFASAEFFIKPMTHNYNASFVFFSLTRPFNCSIEVAKVLLVMYSGSYAMTISLIAVQFIYRYWALFHQNRIKYFKGFKMLLWVLFSSYFMFDWAASVYFLGERNEQSDEYLFLEFLSNYKQDVRNLTHFAAIIYSSDWVVDWTGVSTMASVSKNVIIQYVIIIYCGVIMHRKMGEKMEQFSFSNRRVHQQLFKTLVVQITLPTFLIFLPVMGMFLLPFFNLKISLPTGTLLCALSVYPAMDGVAVMYIITDYRFAIQSYFVKLLRLATFNRIGLHAPAEIFSNDATSTNAVSKNDMAFRPVRPRGHSLDF